MAFSFIWMMFVLFPLALRVRDLGVVSQEVTSSTFIDYGAEPPNCTNSFNQPSYISCAVSCMSRTECQAFMFKTQDQTCTVCMSEAITKLTFSGQPFLYRRRQTVYNQTTLTLSRTLTPGDLIYLSATIYDEMGVILIVEHASLNWRALHMSVRLNEGRTAISSIDNNSTWLELKYSSSPFPFAFGERLDIHILTTYDRFMFYFDQEFCCDYVYQTPIEEMSRIRTGRTAQIHELSC